MAGSQELSISSPAKALCAAVNHATPIPLVLLDGERESQVGTVVIDRRTEFHKLLSEVGRKLGTSTQCISLSLVRCRKTRSSSDEGTRGKMQINETSDFAAIARTKDCYVLAKIKRQRGMPRKWKSQVNHEPVVEEKSRSRSKSRTTTAVVPVSTPERMISRRPMPELLADVGYGVIVGVQNPFEYDVMLEIPMYWQYMMVMMSNAAAAAAALAAYRPHYGNSYGGDVVAATCKICSGEEGIPLPEFHCCVDDAVVNGFRTIYGPIERPNLELEPSRGYFLPFSYADLD